MPSSTSWTPFDGDYEAILSVTLFDADINAIAFRLQTFPPNRVGMVV